MGRQARCRWRWRTAALRPTPSPSSPPVSPVAGSKPDPNHLPRSPTASPSLRQCAAGSGTTTSGCWRPRCRPALTSPRCSPRARRSVACCNRARRRHSHSSPPRRVRRWTVGVGRAWLSPTSSHARSPLSAMSRSAPDEISAWRIRCADYALLSLICAPTLIWAPAVVVLQFSIHS